MLMSVVIVAGVVVWVLAVGLVAASVGGLGADTSIVDPDYLLEPLVHGKGTWLVLGLVGAALTVVGALLGRRQFSTGRMSRSAVIVAVASAAVTAYAGLTYGTATSPTIGANIGAGLLLLGFVPFVVVVAVLLVALLRRPPSSGA